MADFSSSFLGVRLRLRVRPRDPRHHDGGSAGQVHAGCGHRGRRLPPDWLPHHGIRPPLHRQRHEEPAGHCRRHRHHLQGM